MLYEYDCPNSYPYCIHTVIQTIIQTIIRTIIQTKILTTIQTIIQTIIQTFLQNFIIILPLNQGVLGVKTLKTYGTKPKWQT